MQLLDIFPLAYWLRTRIASVGNFVAYVAMYFIYTLFVISQTGELSAAGAAVFFLLWAGYMSLYELGYLANDSWSQVREAQLGLNTHKPPISLPRRYLIPGIILRTALFCAVCTLGFKTLPVGRVHLFLCVSACSVAAFAVHNYVFFPWRVITFWILYCLRYSLPGVLLLRSGIGTPSLWVVLLAPAFSFTIAYFFAKGRRSKAANNVVFHLRITALLLLIFLGAGLVAKSSGGVALPAIGLVISIDILFGVARFLREVLHAVADQSVHHVHTNFSHDCEMPLQQSASHPALLGRTVMLTDHAETFSSNRYRELISAVQDLEHSSASVKFIPGLEYSVLGQHILAYGLNEYASINSERADSVVELKNKSYYVVWAHPHFAIRKVLCPQYVLGLLCLMKYVDGLEFVNFKSSRGLHFRWRHLVISLIAVLLFGSKRLTIGVDAHHYDDFDRYAEAKALSRFALLYSCLFRGGAIPFAQTRKD